MSDAQQLVLSLFVLAALCARPVSTWIKRQLDERRANKWIAEKLAGRDAKQLIKNSPYAYGHAQGESGYRITDDRVEPPFIGFAPTIEHAEAQILTMILQEEEEAGQMDARGS